MSTDRLPGNAAGTAVRLLLSGLVMLLLYRFLLDQLGAELLGAWALVLATAATGSTGTFGMGGTLVRFVAARRLRYPVGRLTDLLHTALISAAALLLLAGAVLLLLGPSLLALALPSRLLPPAIDVLPVALGAFWVAGLGGIYQSYCEGLQRYDVTNAILLGGVILHAGLCVLLVPPFGLPGAALAHLGQAILVCLSFAAACRLLPGGAAPLPRRWSRAVFRELLPYGARLQMMSILAALHDPVTKYLVGMFGGVPQTAYYDLAARLVGTLRQILVGPALPLVPAIAELQESDEGRAHEIHGRAQALLLLTGSAMMIVPAALAGFLSVLWLGAPVGEFILAFTLLAIAWFVNAVSASSYLSFLGRGELNAPMASHLTVAVCTVALGVLCGSAGGYAGVVVAASLSIIAGSVLTMFLHRRRHGHPGAQTGGRSTARLLLFFAGSVACGHTLFSLLVGKLDVSLLTGAGILAFILMAGTMIRLQPARTELRRSAAALGSLFVPPAFYRLLFRLAYSDKFPFLSFVDHATRLDSLRSAVAARWGLIEGNLEGMRIGLDVRHAVDLLCWIGRFEPAQRQFLRGIVRKGDTIVDAGANIGVYTLLFARWTGSAGRVVAFEPAPGTATRLEAGVRRNGLENVQVQRLALADREGETFLQLTADPGFSSLGEPTGRSPVVERVAVPVTTLDRFCSRERIDRIHLLKMDIEGFELPALVGARGMLSGGRIDALVVEYNREAQTRNGFDPGALPARLRSHGYAVHVIGKRGLQPFPADGMIGYAELICLRTTEEERS